MCLKNQPHPHAGDEHTHDVALPGDKWPVIPTHLLPVVARSTITGNSWRISRYNGLTSRISRYYWLSFVPRVESKIKLKFLRVHCKMHLGDREFAGSSIYSMQLQTPHPKAAEILRQCRWVSLSLNQYPINPCGVSRLGTGAQCRHRYTGIRIHIEQEKARHYEMGLLSHLKTHA